jgi:hypothetical protein
LLFLLLVIFIACYFYCLLFLLLVIFIACYFWKLSENLAFGI